MSVKTPNQILEMQLWDRQSQTMQKLTAVEPDKQHQRTWLDKWIKLDSRHHPKLRHLETVVYQYVADMAAKPMEGYPLIICGTNGSGKTHTVKAIHRWCVGFAPSAKMPEIAGNIPSFDCSFIYWPELIDQIKSAEWARVDSMIEPRVLIIDDLGSEYDPSKLGIDKLCRVLSCRENKWTIVTTNIPPEQWTEVFDQRVASRMFRGSNIVDLFGVPDYAAK